MTTVDERPLPENTTTLNPYATPLPYVFASSALAEIPTQAVDALVVVTPPLDRGPDAAALADYLSTRLTEFFGFSAGWDGHRAQLPTREALAATVAAAFALAVGVRLRPQLVPLPSGGIQLEWHALTSVEITAEASGELHALTTDEGDEIVMNDGLDLEDTAMVDELRHQLELMATSFPLPLCLHVLSRRSYERSGSA